MTIIFLPWISLAACWVLACVGAVIVLIFKCIETVVLMNEGTDAINSEFGVVDCDLDTPSGGTSSDYDSDTVNYSDVDYRRKEYYDDYGGEFYA